MTSTDNSTRAEAENVKNYVGTLVGESTSQEFRLAIAQGSTREQDIIAVDATLRAPDNDEQESIRIWAKVQRIERVNPLFPTESAHELAATATNPFDTVLSLSREMVTAVCQVIGYEPSGAESGAKLRQLRYPAQPATAAYKPDPDAVSRIVVGEFENQSTRGLDLATLANQPSVNVKVDGHSIVTRHMAILAMTGAGKSWTARTLIEQLADRNYPIVIFDPHGDYAGLSQVESIGRRAQVFYAQFPVFEQEHETVQSVVSDLAWPLAPTQRSYFNNFLRGAKVFYEANENERSVRAEWLSNYLENDAISKFGIKPNLFLMADLVEATIKARSTDDSSATSQIIAWTDEGSLNFEKRQAQWLDGLVHRLRTAGRRLHQMEQISKRTSGAAQPLPNERHKLVEHGKISIIALSGYPSDFQAILYTLIAQDIFSARIDGRLGMPVLLLLEEAHRFAPPPSNESPEKRSTALTRQIAQEGRKFNVGLVLISQRPSRLDETTLSQCNSHVVMRLVNPADQLFVRRAIESLSENETRMLPNLEVGEAILAGQMTNFPLLVKINAPKSQGEREEKDAFEYLEDARKELAGAGR